MKWHRVISMDRFLQKQSCPHYRAIIGEAGAIPLLEYAHYIMDSCKGFLIRDNYKIIINKIILKRREINTKDCQE